MDIAVRNKWFDLVWFKKKKVAARIAHLRTVWLHWLSKLILRRTAKPDGSWTGELRSCSWALTALWYTIGIYFYYLLSAFNEIHTRLTVLNSTLDFFFRKCGRVKFKIQMRTGGRGIDHKYSLEQYVSTFIAWLRLYSSSCRIIKSTDECLHLVPVIYYSFMVL